MDIKSLFDGDPLLGVPELCELFGSEKKPANRKTVGRHFNRPGGLAHIEIAGKKYARLSVVRKYFLDLERQPNPRRGGRRHG